MAIVLKNGKQRKVKNLGWLLRHWKEIEYINVFETRDSYDLLMYVKLVDSYYITRWASRIVCWEWLLRPTFYDLPIFWFNHERKIG